MAIVPLIDEYTIDLRDETNYYFAKAPQGDGRDRYIKLTIEDNHEPYTLDPTNMYVIGGKNPAGYGIYIECSVDQEDNTLMVPLSDTILADAGLGRYEIFIYPGGQGSPSIASFPFNIFVSECPLDIIRIQQNDNYQALAELVNRAKNMNRWYVGDDDPPTFTVGVDPGDYYLAQTTGNIYVYLDSGWSSEPIGNLKIKIYVRYSHNADGSNMTTAPVSKQTDPVNYSRYIGIYTGLDTTVPVYTSFDWMLFQNGIASTEVKYAENAQGDDPSLIPTADWQSSIPTMTKGNFLWTRVIVNYDDGNSTTLYSVARDGLDGNLWYIGTSISGGSSISTGTVFVNSGVTYANINDLYLNRTEGAVYHCVLNGGPSVAQWIYDFTMTGAGIMQLGLLDDVTLTNVQNGHALVYNGTSGHWENRFANLGELGDVTITSPVPGQVLAFNDAGTGWENVKNFTRFGGSKTFSQLTSSLLVAGNSDKFFLVTDGGTIASEDAANWVLPAGSVIPADSHIAVVEISTGVYKFDDFGGYVDISGKADKTELDDWTDVSYADANYTVVFDNLDNSYSYDLHSDATDVVIDTTTVTSGTSSGIKITYIVGGDNITTGSSGTQFKLRIIK